MAPGCQMAFRERARKDPSARTVNTRDRTRGLRIIVANVGRVARPSRDDMEWSALPVRLQCYDPRVIENMPHARSSEPVLAQRHINQLNVAVNMRKAGPEGLGLACEIVA